MSRLDLQRLAAARLPGLPDGFVVEARPGVNLVLGANESGKSSFVRAVQRLLWPDRPGASPFEVTATFADDAGPLQAVRRDDGPVGWSRDGAPVPAPAVPEGHLAHCYRLGLLDLNRPDGDDADRELARQVRRQMSGGYDLAAVRELFPDRERAVGMRRRRWQETRRAADDEANAQRRLAREVRSLPAREAEL
ncbi:AAA family ATPase, partial [bacterium]|nr:AAA family ATPase [bacterium]